MAHSTYGTCGWQIILRDPSLTHAIPERFIDEFLVIKRYINLWLDSALLTFLSVVGVVVYSVLTTVLYCSIIDVKRRCMYRIVISPTT